MNAIHPQVVSRRGRRAISFRPRGLTAVLSMVFLALFSTLAIGFYVASTISSQVSRNERNMSQAANAAESGLQFVRYQLGLIDVPPGTPNANLLTTVATLLGQQLNGTPNMNGHSVTVTNGAIYIPAQNEYTTVDAGTGSKFRAMITSSANFLVVKVSGYNTTTYTGKGVQLQYQTAPYASAIFNYGVAAKGAVTMNGNVKIQGATDPTKGSLLSATSSGVPLTVSGNGTISGDFSYTNPAGAPSYTGSVSIGGATYGSPTFPQHVHVGITPPAFPSVDTSQYLQYCTNTWTTSTGKTVINCIVPPNANPSFNGNVTIQGILYIQTPNKVSFAGNTTIQGAIVVENNPQGTGNTISFSGNVMASTIDTLPATSQFPAGERALTGAFLLAPSFAVSFSGNFGTIGGSLVADKFTYSGNAGGTVKGSVIALTDTPLMLSGNSDIIIASTGTSNYPAGVSFGYKYVPLPGTYQEVAP